VEQRVLMELHIQRFPEEVAPVRTFYRSDIFGGRVAKPWILLIGEEVVMSVQAKRKAVPGNRGYFNAADVLCTLS
jgi:hypothetical protein